MMYDTGLAVRRDYKESIRWRRRLVEVTEKRLEKDETYENADLLVRRMNELGCYMMEVSQNSETEDILQRALELGDHYAKKYERVALYRSVADCCNHLGDLYVKKGQNGEAWKYYQRSLTMRDTLCKNLPDADILWYDLSTICMKIAALYLKEKNYSDAKTMYQIVQKVLVTLNTEKARSLFTKFRLNEIYLSFVRLRGSVQPKN